MARLLLFSWIVLISCCGVSALDFVIFALQHPAGYCRSTFKNRCHERNMRDHFTIHGLWPSLLAHGSKFEDCSLYEQFDVKDLAPIRARLEEVWPSVKTNNPVQFWRHEWKKHGTCGVSVPALAGVFRYFNTTLQLFNRFNLMEFLENDDILPSTKIPYSVADFQHALGNDLHSKVNIVCDRADGLQYPVLTEIRFCLNSDLQPTNCPSKKERCGKDKIFFLPLRGDGRLPGSASEAHSSPHSRGPMSGFLMLGSIVIAILLATLHIVRHRIIP